MLTNVRLWNFKCFEYQDIELSALNLLSGLNGMGKSTILQSLLLLRQSHLEGLLERGFLALNGQFVEIGTAKDALFRGAQEEKIGFELRWTDSAHAWGFDYKRETDSNRERDVLDVISTTGEAALQNKSLFTDNFQYLAAERVSPQTSFAMSDYLVRQHRQMGHRGQFAAHFLDVFGGEVLANSAVIHTEAASESLRVQVEHWMGEISPGIRLHLDVHRSIDLVGLQYSTTGGTLPSEPVRPTNFGFGVTYVLPVVVALLSARPGSLLLIENPEAHLHPRGQVMMGDLMARAASGGVQIVTETHSDHVLNGMRIAVHRGTIEPNAVKLHYFQRQGDAETPNTQVVSPQIDRNGRIDSWPGGFFDQWSISLDELLFPAA